MRYWFGGLIFVQRDLFLEFYCIASKDSSIAVFHKLKELILFWFKISFYFVRLCFSSSKVMIKIMLKSVRMLI